MCLGVSQPSTPKPLVPAPPPEPTPEAPVVNEAGAQRNSERSQVSANARGKSSLRIDLALPGAGGNGLNIPT